MGGVELLVDQENRGIRLRLGQEMEERNVWVHLMGGVKRYTPGIKE